MNRIEFVSVIRLPLVIVKYFSPFIDIFFFLGCVRTMNGMQKERPIQKKSIDVCYIR